jgi:hypothetical protein
MNDLPQDQALERDVQLFTALLGEVLREHSRKRVLVIVERLRDGFMQLREGDDPELREKLMKRIEGLDAQTLSEVIRAFNIYFGLVNTAEELNAYLARMDLISAGAAALGRLLRRHGAGAQGRRGEPGKLPEPARASDLSAGLHRASHRGEATDHPGDLPPDLFGRSGSAPAASSTTRSSRTGSRRS